MIAAHYNEEVDACVALDRNFRTLTERTEIGEHFYQAKYHGSEEDFVALADYLLDAMDCANRFRVSEHAYISFIPFNITKTIDLPQKLVKYLTPQLGNAFFGVDKPILDCRLKVPKPAMKNASLEQNSTFGEKW